MKKENKNIIKMLFPRDVVGNLLRFADKQGRDPRQKLSWMTLCNNAASGFTLIELLVVVLIIGILAAAALPQYQRAVDLSRAKQALAMQHKMVEQQRLYFLENGSYASYADMDNLNVNFQLPKDWGILAWNDGNIVIAAFNNQIYIYYFFTQNTSDIQCKALKTNTRLVELCRLLSNGNERTDLEDWRKVYQITL